MTSLQELNRDEWADKPFLIELHGGSADGKRFHWHDLPMIWRQAEPAPLTFQLDPHSHEPPGVPIAVYRETGSVTDEGAHIYVFERYE